ncbi:MAG: multidrug efflux SMR transporter [Peptococcaceae bacterium]|nr:multidrug efflux SMR transporter [Peptococcaceae bacterium]
MAWITLFIAGLFEVFWATCMKLSHGFTVHFYTALTIIGMIASFFLLSHVMKTLPMGTAYAIWTGIGALGSVIVGMLLFKEPMFPLRALFVGMVIVGLIGLKATSGH